jgi:hypothetical protein
MKRSELAEYIKETIVDVLTEVSQEDVKIQKAYNDELLKTKELNQQNLKLTKKLEEDVDDTEKAEKEVTVDPDDSVSLISDKLQINAAAMKTVLNKWKKAEGEEKERLLARLKELTKIQKELEGLL